MNVFQANIDCVLLHMFIAPALVWVGGRKFSSPSLSFPLLSNVKEVLYPRVNRGSSHLAVSTFACLKSSVTEE